MADLRRFVLDFRLIRDDVRQKWLITVIHVNWLVNLGEIRKALTG